MTQEARIQARQAMAGANDEVRHAARVLTKQELTSRLLALFLTAVLVWHTVVLPPNAYAPARRSRRRSPRGEERGAASRRSEVVSTVSEAAGALPEDGACEPVDDLDWPEYIGLD